MSAFFAFERLLDIYYNTHMGVSKNPNARSCRAFCGISASENLSVLALRTHCIFFFELPQNSRQLRTGIVKFCTVSKHTQWFLSLFALANLFFLLFLALPFCRFFF
jgi:hypothetical protein